MSKFKLIGGNLSLDFVNTVNGRISNPNKDSGRDYYDKFISDKLENYSDLLAWSLKATLVDEIEAKVLLRIAGDNPRSAKAVVKRAIRLRECIYRVVRSVALGWSPEQGDMEIVNRELGEARRHQILSANANNFVIEWVGAGRELDSVLWRVSDSAADLLLNENLSRIRWCVNDVCNWLFLDTSRNRTRQWCVMKDCGNLAKVRRFRAKLRSSSKD